MSIEKAIESITLNGGEEFILARDEKHAESMRVSAFNIRRRMPVLINENIGIQKYAEEGRFFVRIFNREVSEAEHWVRDPETSKLIPKVTNELSSENQRIIDFMKQDGKTEDEIQAFIDDV